jgi:E3 ubiquitin-protein ligase UBR3
MQPKQASSSVGGDPTTPLVISVEEFKEICLKTIESNDDAVNNDPTLKTFINTLFNPNYPLKTKARNDVEFIKRYLVGNDNEFDDFKSKLKAFDHSSVCGLVWNVSYVAYRCRTCALSPCMSICAECFRNGDHTGHDFNMFRSGAGGACDCGDECVMASSGFCSSHGNHNQQQNTNRHDPPQNLTKCCEIISAHLIYRLLQHFRHFYSKNKKDKIGIVNNDPVTIILNDYEPYLDLLNELCALGTPLHNIFVHYMTSEQFYLNKIMNEDEEEKKNEAEAAEGDLYKYQVYKDALMSQECIKVPDVFASIRDNICHLESSTMMDEFLFWCIHYQFPEKIVKFLLSLLPHQDYKMKFVRSFISQYSYICVSLLKSRIEYLSSRVVHISVQLFSNEAIAMRALDECYLLPIILSTLHNMIFVTSRNEESPLLKPSLIENKLINRHMVVDPDHYILQENLYWLVVSDLVNLLSHKAVARAFLKDKKCTDTW